MSHLSSGRVQRQKRRKLDGREGDKVEEDAERWGRGHAGGRECEAETEQTSELK